MSWTFADSIPVVGHIKGVGHYLTGDTEKGNKCMRESTRSTVVMGAGAVGGIAGPMGAAAMATSTGMLWDTVESIARDEPTGFIAGVDNIVDSCSKGEAPVGGICQTVLSVGSDALGGLGGSGIANSVSQAATSTAAKSVGKSVGKSASEQILKSATYEVGESFGKSASKSVFESVGKSVSKSVGSTLTKEVTKKVVQNETVIILSHGATRACAKEVEEINRRNKSVSGYRNTSHGSGNSSSGSSNTRSSNTGNSNSSSGNATGSSSGSGQPPRQDPNRNNTSNTNHQQSVHWYEFLRIFGVQSEENIIICGKRIFAGLKNSQVKQLRKQIRILGENGTLSWAIAKIRSILNTCSPESITSTKFLTLLEYFVQWGEFLKIFDAKSLADIIISGQRLFADLNDSLEKSLRKKIHTLIDDGTLHRVIETIRNIFNTFPPEDVTFANFMTLLDYVIEFLNETMARRVELESHRGTKTFKERVEEIVRIVGLELSRHDYTMVTVFQGILRHMRNYMPTLTIKFRDAISAAYHYFKHRYLGDREFSVSEYMHIIESQLRIMHNLEAFQARERIGQTVIRFEIYYGRYGRRFRIVVKKVNGQWVLSSGYFIKKTFEEDEDGWMFLSDERVCF